jgi:hypothetical protein
MNTECKTLGGLNEQQVLTSAKSVQPLWQRLLALCPKDGTEVSIRAANIHSPTFLIVWSCESVEYASIMVSKPNNTAYQKALLVYPQLTYGLPLTHVKNLFAHMRSRYKVQATL